MKILHLTSTRELSKGQRNQLSYESIIAKKEGLDWEVIALTSSLPKSSFEKQLNFVWRPIFLRNIACWLFIVRNCHNYDYVLLRHITFDPFCLIFAPIIKNRISIHHSKEVEELLLIRSGIIGKAASFFEYIFGKFLLKNSAAIIGVTGEIAQYQKERIRSHKKILIYPNGILTHNFSPLFDRRHDSKINIAFICGKFSSWHGLESLIIDIQNNYFEKLINIRINLIGELLQNQKDLIQSNSILKEVFIIHGVLDYEEYRTILEECDVGLASFGLEKKGLKEAATLKVREYLALGLPVYSGHKDAAIPDDFIFYKYGPPKISEIAKFSLKNKNYSRKNVVDKANNYINKEKLMKNLIENLKVLN